MNNIKTISTNNAPLAIGPYDQAKEVNGLVYTSGQLPMNPKTGDIESGIISQTHQSLKNVKAIIEEAGCTMDSILKVSVFLDSMEDFAEMNSVYETYFPNSKPARTALEVAKLPLNARVEIEAIAFRCDG